jgi:hypothetical protein
MSIPHPYIMASIPSSPMKRLPTEISQIIYGYPLGTYPEEEMMTIN